MTERENVNATKAVSVEKGLPESWPSDLSARIAIAIRGHIENGNVGLAAADAAQVAAYYYGQPERLASRQVIAAAPALLAALKELVARCDGEAGVRADGSNIETAQAHAALALVETSVL